MIVPSIKLIGWEKVVKILDDVGKKTEDFSPAFEEISKDFYTGIEGHFAAGGYTPWKPLSAAYASWKERVAPGQPLMVLSGAMKASLTSSTATGAIKEVSPYRLRIGTAVTNKKGYGYPFAHQFGLGNNPVRKVIELPQGTAAKWVSIINSYAFSVITGSSSNWQSSMMSDYGFEEGF